MWEFGGTDFMSDDQVDRWCVLLNRLAHLEAGNPGKYVFHGTSEAVARKIMADGFEPQFVPSHGHDVEKNEKGEAHGIYWGKLHWAALFADRRCKGEATGFPVIIVARLDDVVAAGIPFPDLYALEGAELEGACSWQQSLNQVGAMVSLNCRRVAGLKVANIAKPGEMLAVADDDHETLFRHHWNRDAAFRAQEAINVTTLPPAEAEPVLTP
jgi:hypothetical protein